MTYSSTFFATLPLVFETRDQYLAWRAEWRASYKAHSADIRAMKREIARVQKTGGHAGAVQAELARLRAMAFLKMEQRAETKRRAAEMRQSRLMVAAA